MNKQQPSATLLTIFPELPESVIGGDLTASSSPSPFPPGGEWRIGG